MIDSKADDKAESLKLQFSVRFFFMVKYLIHYILILDLIFASTSCKRSRFKKIKVNIQKTPAMRIDRTIHATNKTSLPLSRKYFTDKKFDSPKIYFFTKDSDALNLADEDKREDLGWIPAVILSAGLAIYGLSYGNSGKSAASDFKSTVANKSNGFPAIENQPSSPVMKNQKTPDTLDSPVSTPSPLFPPPSKDSPVSTPSPLFSPPSKDSPLSIPSPLPPDSPVAKQMGPLQGTQNVQEVNPLAKSADYHFKLEMNGIDLDIPIVKQENYPFFTPHVKIEQIDSLQNVFFGLNSGEVANILIKKSDKDVFFRELDLFTGHVKQFHTTELQSGEILVSLKKGRLPKLPVGKETLPVFFLEHHRFTDLPSQKRFKVDTRVT